MQYARRVGDRFHLNIRDIDSWYEKNFPGLNLIPLTCFYCRAKLQNSDEVVVRSSGAKESPIQPGTRVQLTGILRVRDGEALFRVEHPDGFVHYLIRAQLRRVHNDKM